MVFVLTRSFKCVALINIQLSFVFYVRNTLKKWKMLYLWFEHYFSLSYTQLYTANRIASFLPRDHPIFYSILQLLLDGCLYLDSWVQ